MGFRDFTGQKQGIELLQRSLERGRLAHAYLFTGTQLDILESLAFNLARTLNCQKPEKRRGASVDACGQCLPCQKIEHGNHADVHWVRPESKTRIITIDQVRDLMREIQLKPSEAEYKIAVIVAADRLKVEAANAFLKTLEEPPAKSIIVLLSTEPQRLLETIISRCLRINFGGDALASITPAQVAWLEEFSEIASSEQKSLIARYRLLDVLLKKLRELREAIEDSLTKKSPLTRYSDISNDLRDKWEDELKAAIEAEYRRQRGDWLAILQWWLRDVWLHNLKIGGSPGSAGESGTLLAFPKLSAPARSIAGRITPQQALENLRVIEQLQRRLHTNVQESLALEVGLLKLAL
jgi:DNA polymerase-3 subunit delta'